MAQALVDLGGTDLPTAPDAERGFVAGLLWGEGLAERSEGRLDENDLNDHRYRAIYATARALVREGQPVDRLTVTARLRRLNQLDQVGGEIFLATLHEEAAITAHAEALISEIRDASVKRELVTGARRLAVEAMNGTPASSLLETAGRWLQTIRDRQLDAGPRKPQLRTLADSLARDPADLQVRYIVKPWLVAQGVTILTGAPGTGKGKFVQDLAIARGAGQAFLGAPLTAGPVLFWSGEQGRNEDDRVNQAFARGRGLHSADVVAPVMLISDPALRLGAPTMLATVLALVRQHPELLIIVDSLRRAFEGNENESEVADTFFWSVLAPLRHAGATVLLLAHPPKPPAQGDLRLDSLIRGSGDWLAMVDGLLILKAATRTRRDDGSEEIKSLLIHHKARRGSKAEVGVLVLHVKNDDTPDLAFSLTHEPGGSGIVEAQIVVEALANFFREKGLGTKADYLEHFTGRFSKKVLDPARDVLLRQGLIRKLQKEERPPGVRGTAYGWVETPEDHPFALVDLNETSPSNEG